MVEYHLELLTTLPERGPWWCQMLAIPFGSGVPLVECLACYLWEKELICWIKDMKADSISNQGILMQLMRQIISKAYFSCPWIKAWKFILKRYFCLLIFWCRDWAHKNRTKTNKSILSPHWHRRALGQRNQQLLILKHFAITCSCSLESFLPLSTN